MSSMTFRCFPLVLISLFTCSFVVCICLAILSDTAFLQQRANQTSSMQQSSLHMSVTLNLPDTDSSSQAVSASKLSQASTLAAHTLPPDAACTPTTRRALAERGAQAKPEEWRRVADCIIGLCGALRFLHLEFESGGSSVCQMYRDNGCNAGPSGNCNMHTNLVDFGPKWVRKAHSSWRDGPGPQWTPDWMTFHQKSQLRRTRLSCQDLRRQVEEQRIMLAMDERWLPASAPCIDFMNVVVVREPFRRMLSHFHVCQPHACHTAPKTKVHNRCFPHTHFFLLFFKLVSIHPFAGIVVGLRSGGAEHEKEEISDARRVAEIVSAREK